MSRSGVDGVGALMVPRQRRGYDGEQRDAGETRECSRSPIASWSGKEAGLEELRASATFGWDG
jgi:hypothetical protein